MKLGLEVGRDHGHNVLDGDPAPPLERGTAPQVSAHVGCGQTTGWIKMLLGREVGLGPGHSVLDRDPTPPPQMSTAPNFRSISIVTKPSPISATAEHLLCFFRFSVLCIFLV